jgi:hypothetical protein
MKIAVTISGLPRFTKDFDDLLTSLQDYDQIDWFFYLWTNGTDQSVPPIWNTMNVDEMRAKIEVNLPERHKIAHLSLNEIPEYNVEREPPPNPWTVIKGVWYNHLGLKRVTEIREQYEQEHGQYDVVIRARPDVGITPISLRQSYEFILANPNVILMPSNNKITQFKVSDLTAIGSSRTISVYSTMFDHMLGYHDRGVLYHPETLTGYHLYVNGIVSPDIPHLDFHMNLRSHTMPDGSMDFGRWS